MNRDIQHFIMQNHDDALERYLQEFRPEQFDFLLKSRRMAELTGKVRIAEVLGRYLSSHPHLWGHYKH